MNQEYSGDIYSKDLSIYELLGWHKVIKPVPAFYFLKALWKMKQHQHYLYRFRKWQTNSRQIIITDKQLEDATGFSVSTIRRYAKILEGLGLIKLSNRAQNHKGEATVWEIVKPILCLLKFRFLNFMKGVLGHLDTKKEVIEYIKFDHLDKLYRIPEMDETINIEDNSISKGKDTNLNTKADQIGNPNIINNINNIEYKTEGDRGSRSSGEVDFNNKKSFDSNEVLSEGVVNHILFMASKFLSEKEFEHNYGLLSSKLYGIAPDKAQMIISCFKRSLDVSFKPRVPLNFVINTINNPDIEKTFTNSEVWSKNRAKESSNMTAKSKSSRKKNKLPSRNHYKDRFTKLNK